MVVMIPPLGADLVSGRTPPLLSHTINGQLNKGAAIYGLAREKGSPFRIKHRWLAM